jgi:hypothetical protein
VHELYPFRRTQYHDPSCKVVFLDFPSTLPPFRGRMFCFAMQICRTFFEWVPKENARKTHFTRLRSYVRAVWRRYPHPSHETAMRNTTNR